MSSPPKRIYLIAGEASGDLLGSKLMESLKKQTNLPLAFFGIGGEKMHKNGLNSLFPMQEISLMGFLEIIPHLPHLFRRIHQTVHHIHEINPDIIITIDSPGFNCQVAKRLRPRHFPIIHYVAPSVWAYKPKRAKKFASLFDHLLTLLPFEPPYFEKEGLNATFVGHPIMEQSTVVQELECTNFLSKHHLSANAPILLAMPGSRITEINRLLPIYLNAFLLLKEKIPTLQVVIPTLSALSASIAPLIASHREWIKLIDAETEKQMAYAVSHFALVKSGTGTLEVARAHVPMIVAYKVSILSAWLIRWMINIPYVSLINIIAKQPVLPEFLQSRCRADLLADALLELYQNTSVRQAQLDACSRTLHLLQPASGSLPSDQAAQLVLKYL